jgi:hypothetical protein
MHESKWCSLGKSLARLASCASQSMIEGLLEKEEAVTRADRIEPNV